MGLFSKFKNYITGGAADLKVEMNQRILESGETLNIKVTATAKEHTLDIRHIYVIITAIEKSARDFVVYKKRIDIEGKIQLNGLDSKSWSYDWKIPDDISPTFIAKHSQMQWYVRGGLDVSGNDPVSDWESFVINSQIDWQTKK